MQQTRPKNLNLFTIRFPLPAIVSILHRITGVILFLLIPLLLWTLDYSLSLYGFDTLQQWLGNFYVKAFLWLCLIPLCFHLIAGIRHLLSDIHIGDTLKGGRMGSVWVFILSVLVVILVGIWLW